MEKQGRTIRRCSAEIRRQGEQRPTLVDTGCLTLEISDAKPFLLA